MTYDNAGNLVTKAAGSWSYGYDALERLVSVRQAGVLIARYGYDVAGRRVVKRVYSGATGGTVGYLRMGYAGGQVAFETDSANMSLTTVYTWGPGVDQLVGVRVSGTDYTVVTDPLGSVRALVRRSDGAWMGRLAYDPYGQLLDSAGPGPALRYRWTGREYDAETGFYFHRTRYYDPAVGRFVQEDRAGYGGGGNLYAYVDGNVLQARDPDGLTKEWGDGGYGFDPMCTLGGSALTADGSVIMGGCSMGSATVGGGGGAGSAAGAAALIAWGAANDLVFDSWEQYVRNYEAHKAEIGGPGTLPMVAQMFAGSAFIKRNDFALILRAVSGGTDLSSGFGDYTGLQVASSFLSRLISGYIFMNTGFVEANRSNPNVRAITMLGITVLSEAVFAPNIRIYLPNALIHEELHNLLPSAPECDIYHQANSLTHTTVPCPSE